MINISHICHEHYHLSKVLMHRPGDEMKKVTAENLDYFHFAAPVDPEKYLEEFDQLKQAFENLGAEVVLVNEVLKDDADAQHYIAKRPNMVFTRDLAVVTPKGAIMLGMTIGGRQGDPAMITKTMKQLDIPILGEMEAHGGLLEGGGITYFRGDTAIVGQCSRTNPKGLELVETWFRQAGLRQMITIPCKPQEIHIDGILVFIDSDLAIVHPPDLKAGPACIKNLHTGEIQHQDILDYLNQQDVQFIEINEQERHDAAANWVMVRPRQIVGYDWAERVMNEVEKRGGKAIGVPGNELFKGKGGPHCMTCPLERLPE